MNKFPDFRKHKKDELTALYDKVGPSMRGKARPTETVCDTKFGVLTVRRYPFGRKLRKPGEKFRFGPMRGKVVDSKFVPGSRNVTTVVALNTKHLNMPSVGVTSKRRQPYHGETVLVVFKDTSGDAGTSEDGSYVGLGEYRGHVLEQDGEQLCWVRVYPGEEPPCLFPCSCVYESRFLIWM